MTHSHHTSKVQRGFANIVDQCPGAEIDGKVYKLLAVDESFYLLRLKAGQCTVFTVFPYAVFPTNEFQCSAWTYLCEHQLPKDCVKEVRFTVDLNRRLTQGARNFALRINAKFNLAAAFSAFTSMGGQL